MSDEERNLEHKRAEYAFECISGIIGTDEKKYRSSALSCGVLIQKTGLMQTMAFYLSKKGQQERLAEHILGWIMYYRHGGNAVDLFNQMLISNDERLMQMTLEAQALIKWLKRFAEAGLKKGETVTTDIVGETANDSVQVNEEGRQ